MGTPLGDFIRAKRDATAPGQLGLADDGRRRAPGLRRTEVAARAGISVEYLTRIEQGRDRHPSIPVINAIADALALTPQERRHVNYLAKLAGGACAGRSVASGAERHEAWPAAREVLRQLEPNGMAVITNKLADVFAYTSGFADLIGFTGLLDAHEPNIARFVFTDARAKDILVNWDYVADACAFDLWHASTVSAAREFTDELTPIAGRALTDRMNLALPPAPEPWEIRLETGDFVRCNREVLDISASPDQQIAVFIPADERSRRAVESARHDRIPPLHAV